MPSDNALKYETDLNLVQKALLDDQSRHLRRLIFRAIEHGGRGHIGPALSLVEIIRVLYDDFVRHDPAKPAWRERDRFILSKGHGCLALYAVLADKGFFPILANSTAFAISIRSSAAIRRPSCRVSRPPPARSAMACRSGSAWRWPPA